MIVGPIFTREFVTLPRRQRLYIQRATYAMALFILMCTAWLLFAGTQIIRNLGDMSRFGSTLFQILAPLQLALVMFASALMSASAVTQEKDRRTLILLLMTRLTNSELVLGKLGASLLAVVVLLAASLPIFALLIMFGGVSYQQVIRSYLVTLTTVFAAGSLGATMAFWREKTFQTLALTALILVAYLGFWETVAAGAWGERWWGTPTETWACWFSPLRALHAASLPQYSTPSWRKATFPDWSGFAAASLAIGMILNAWAIMRVRVWNPSRELRAAEGKSEGKDEDAASIFMAQTSGLGADVVPLSVERAEEARTAHIDSRLHDPARREGSRPVWDNPVLWREVCTWAHGKKIVIIRLVYAGLSLAALWTLYSLTGNASANAWNETRLPDTAKVLIPSFLVSLVMINALAVTSVTAERDGQALDLLLVTDLSPLEFIAGKVGGVIWVGKEIWILPLLLSLFLWWRGGIGLENLIYVIGGLVTMYVFVTALGIHCGMIYDNSRTAIGVSLGTVFFLFLGVATCILLMISFSGSFQIQLFPFLAFIAGGAVGLYVTWGARNPSGAIGVASLILPLATFYAITSFLLGHTLPVFLVTACSYGFASAAMLVPALYEFESQISGSAG